MIANGLPATLRLAALVAATATLAAAQQVDQCRAWQERFAALSPELQEKLETVGLLRGPLVGPKIVPRCEDRIPFPDYIQDRVAGSPEDEAILAYWSDHRGRLGEYVRRAWPLLSDHGGPLADGAFTSDVYAVLQDDLVPSEDALAAVVDEVRAQGVGVGLPFVLWNRDLDSGPLVRALRERFSVAVAETNAVELFHTAAALYWLGAPVFPEVERYVSTHEIPARYAPSVDKIVQGMRAGEPLDLADVAELEYH